MEDVKVAVAAADAEAAPAEEEEEEELSRVVGGAGAGRRAVALPSTLRCTGTDGRFDGTIAAFSWLTWVGLERFIPVETRGRIGLSCPLGLGGWDGGSEELQNPDPVGDEGVVKASSKDSPTLLNRYDAFISCPGTSPCCFCGHISCLCCG